jgi:hypothetical protein
MVVTMDITVLCDVMPCNLADRYHFPVLKKEATDSSKALETVPEDSNLQIQITSQHAPTIWNDLSLQTVTVQHGVHLQGNGSVAMNGELCTLNYVFPASTYLIGSYYVFVIKLVTQINIHSIFLHSPHCMVLWSIEGKGDNIAWVPPGFLLRGTTRKFVIQPE